MGQAQINVRTRACSRTSIARTKQAALTHNVRGKELRQKWRQKWRTTFKCLDMNMHKVFQGLSCQKKFVNRNYSEIKNIVEGIIIALCFLCVNAIVL